LAFAWGPAALSENCPQQKEQTTAASQTAPFTFYAPFLSDWEVVSELPADHQLVTLGAALAR